MTDTQNTKAQAVHDLVCDMLRGHHVQFMPEEELRAYTYNAGVALHNLPGCIARDNSLSIYQLEEINRLDPSTRGDGWGDWARRLAAGFGQSLPEKP